MGERTSPVEVTNAVNNKPSILNVSPLRDRYDIKARLLPALFSILPTSPGIAAFGTVSLDWYAVLLLEGGIAVVCGTGLSYIASAAGTKYERKIWSNWPYDLPTHTWLLPDDSRISPQQKQIYYRAIHELLGLDIEQAAGTGDPQVVKATIDDAVRNLRHMFRTLSVKGLLAKHNEDYGFMRNFAGLCPCGYPRAFFPLVQPGFSTSEQEQH